MKLRTYCFFSLGILITSVLYAFYSKRTFFSTTLYLSESKLHIAVFGNSLFMLAVLISCLLKTIFFGPLNNDEIQNIIDNGKWSFIDTCLALTMFREDLDLFVVFMFTSLMFAKIFHWVITMRVESIGHLTQLSFAQHIRYILLIFSLNFIDIFVSFNLATSFTGNNDGVLVLFLFEFTILVVSSFYNGLKYLILCIDSHYEGRWSKKPTFMFCINLFNDLCNFFLYLVFFINVCVNYGVPLYLIRDLYVVYIKLRKCIVEYVTYKKLIKNMKKRFPDVRDSDFGESDRTCIICREEMIVGKRLPCNHVFHFECLRGWFERQHSCPTCRADIPIVEIPSNVSGQSNNNISANVEPPPSVQVTQINQNYDILTNHNFHNQNIIQNTMQNIINQNSLAFSSPQFLESILNQNNQSNEKKEFLLRIVEHQTYMLDRQIGIVQNYLSELQGLLQLQLNLQNKLYKNAQEFEEKESDERSSLSQNSDQKTETKITKIDKK